LKILDVLPSLDEKFDPSNRDYIKTTVPVKNVIGAKLPNAFDSTYHKPVVYRNGDSVDDEIGLTFDSHDYDKDVNISKDGIHSKKSRKKKLDNEDE